MVGLRSSASSSATSSPADVLERIRAQVGDLGRPRAGLDPVTALDHLPGRTGMIAGLQNLYGMRTRGGDHLRDLVVRHGKVFRYPLGPIPCVWVTDADALSEITRNASRTWSAALGWRLLFDGIDPSRPYMDAPGNLDFEPHKDIRKLLQPGFSAAAMTSYVGATFDQAETAIDDWLAAGRVRFKPAARRLFAGIAGRVFLGGSDPRETELLDRTIAALWKGAQAVSKRAWLSPAWRRALGSWRELHQLLHPTIAARRSGEAPDLFSRTCRAAPEIDWVDDDTLFSCFVGVMMAAFDTTSMGVINMAYLLATHPEWQDRLYEEGRDLPARLTSDELKQLEQCDRAWRETLRRYTIAPFLPRRPLCDVELAGHHIPAGAMVGVMIAPLHLDPEVWTAPERFDPDRFSPERAEDRRKRGAYLPFGAGAHACIGAQLSTMEAKAFWHAFLRRARIRLARPYVARHEIRPLGAVSGDVELIVERRGA